VKTTLNLDDDLVARAKAAATRERSTLTRLIEEGLILRLKTQGRRRRATGSLPELPVSSRRGGLQPGIDGTSNRSMLDAADE
jgi:hypothetical protein